MNKPPDSGGTNIPPDDNGMDTPSSPTNKNTSITITTPGPKYLVITRKDEGKTLSNVSPFLIKKVVDYTCDGEVSECKKLRNGTILVRTKTSTQANKLMQLTSLSPNINISISYHNSLNFVKGVIYSNDLRGIPEEEILSELKEQNVLKIEKIKRKVNDIIEETGLIIITFGCTTLPNEIYIGYERVKIRPYIPLPLRCRQCLRYGHISKVCKNSKTCSNCSLEFHTKEDEICTRPKNCFNCQMLDSVDPNHSPLDKKCPIFLKEREIQSIMTLEKVNKKIAISVYKQRHPTTGLTYSSIVKKPNDENRTINSHNDIKKSITPINKFSEAELPSCSHKQPPKVKQIISYANISDFELSELEVKKLNTIQQSKEVTGDTSSMSSAFDMELSNSDPELPQQQQNKKVIILPKTTSKKNKRKIGAKILSGKSSKAAKI